MTNNETEFYYEEIYREDCNLYDLYLYMGDKLKSIIRFISKDKIDKIKDQLNNYNN